MNSSVVSSAVTTEGFGNSNRPLKKRLENHKCVYFVITFYGGFTTRWYRNTDLHQTYTMSVDKFFSGKKVLLNHRVVQIIFTPETTEEELQELITFWYADEWGNLRNCLDCSEQDKQLIENRLVGFITTDYKKTLPKK